MSTTPTRYQANERLIDQPDELRRLYCQEDYSIREIAANHASVGRTRVSDALQEYDITDDDEDSQEAESTPHDGDSTLSTRQVASSSTTNSNTGQRGLAPARANSVGSLNCGYGEDESAPPQSGGASGPSNEGLSWDEVTD
jgi:hypothetical protein